MKSIPEGSVYAFPLIDDGLGLAVVARRMPRGRIVALYLYGDAPPGALRQEPYSLPRPDRAVFKGLFADYALRDGSWRALGVHPSFVRSDWPFNLVLHHDLDGRRSPVLIHLDDRNPNREVRLEVVSGNAELGEIPSDVLNAPERMERFVVGRDRGESHSD